MDISDYVYCGLSALIISPFTILVNTNIYDSLPPQDHVKELQAKDAEIARLLKKLSHVFD